MFLFEAQTGRCSDSFHCSHDRLDHDWRSNYYHFLLDDEHRLWVEKIVEAAEVGSSGLVYERLTLEALHNRDLNPAVERGRVVLD